MSRALSRLVRYRMSEIGEKYTKALRPSKQTPPSSPGYGTPNGR